MTKAWRWWDLSLRASLWLRVLRRLVLRGLSDSSALPKGGLLLAVVVSLQAVVVTYDGWYAAIYFTEEDEDPVRDLPASSISGVLACVGHLPAGECGSASRSANATLATSADSCGRRGEGNHREQGQGLDSNGVDAGGDQHDQCVSAHFAADSLRYGSRWVDAALDDFDQSWWARLRRRCCFVRWMALALIFSGSFETLIAVASFLFVAVYIVGVCGPVCLASAGAGTCAAVPDVGISMDECWCFCGFGCFSLLSVVADPKDAFFTLMLIAVCYPVYFFTVSEEVPREVAVIDTDETPA